MSDLVQQSDPNADPELKAALRRLHAGHVAADGLRNRVSMLLQNPPAELPGTDVDGAAAVAGRIAPAPPRNRWIRPIAIAAVVLLAIGITAVVVRQRMEESDRRNAYYVQRNLNVLKAMVATAATPPADATAPADRVADVSDPKAVHAELGRRLSRQVPTPDLSAAGWQLKDAASVAFRSEPAARFDFAKADHRVTVMSVPLKVFGNPDEDDTYDTTIDGHAISGYVAHDGVHCVIGDSGMPLNEITALRKQIQSL